MKNIEKGVLETCILVGCHDFNIIMNDIFGQADVDYSLDGLTVTSYDENGNEISIENERLNKALATYFDVKAVTSVHIDDCDYVGVWLCYVD